MNWSEFLTIAAIHLLAVASPGPDFAIVVRHSMHYGKRIAILTSCGIGVGILVHVIYSLVGLSVVIATTPWLFSAIKYAATAYLLYLAWGALRSQPMTLDDKTAPVSVTTMSAKKAFTVGFITNGINPKATLFFLSLFTLVIDPQTTLTAKSIYGVYLAVATGLWFCMLSSLLNVGRVLNWLQQYSYWVDRAMGALLVVVACNILFFAQV